LIYCEKETTSSKNHSINKFLYFFKKYLCDKNQISIL